jgi:TrmH family RNA methyltransferase
MLSKAQIKLIKSLSQKKYRREHRLFLAEGTKIAHEILHSGLEVQKLYALASWLDENGDMLAKGVPVESVTEKELESISALTTPQEVLLLVKMPKLPPLQKELLMLALESIRDPGNLGTIIRLADWYGLRQIILSPDCVDAYNPKVVQSTMGSIARVSCHYLPLTETFEKLKLPVYAAALGGETDVHRLSRFQEGILLIGNESEGLSEEMLHRSQHRISIPRVGEAESLNAAIATGILLDNLRRMMG